LPDRDIEILAAIERFGLDRCARHDPAHDALHVSRVVNNARTILSEEPDASVFITEAAAWMHDIVQLPKGTSAAGESARQSADVAMQFLVALGVDDFRIQAITHAIEAHSFSGGLLPDSKEAAIVQDADRLDALGAIGIARLWVTAGTMDSHLYSQFDPAGTERHLDDKTYGLDHIERKLLKLPGMMNTEAGRRIAAARAKYVALFRCTFLDEIAGNA
jgi:uncharacterized protein